MEAMGGLVPVLLVSNMPSQGPGFHFCQLQVQSLASNPWRATSGSQYLMKVLDQLPLPLSLWKQKSETLHNDFRCTKKFKFCNTLSITNWLSGFQDDWRVILTHQSFSLEASHFLRTTASHCMVFLWNNIDALLNPQMWWNFHGLTLVH